MRNLTLYHLTPHENEAAILRDGIVANEDGEIFLFTDMLVADTIAGDQVITKRYVVFQIDRKGVTSRLRPDKVAEFSRGYHRIVKQDCIKPEFLTLVGVFDTASGPTEWNYLSNERKGISRAQTDGMSAITAWCNLEASKGILSTEAIEAEANRRLSDLFPSDGPHDPDAAS